MSAGLSECMAKPNAVHVTPLVQLDEDDWRCLWGAYQRFYEVELPEAVHASTWSRLLDPSDPVYGAIGRDGRGAAIGLVHFIRHRTCWDTADSCYLQDPYVDESRRGTGVGRVLIAHVVDCAAEFGAANVHWLTHETNLRAKRLYDAVSSQSGFIQYKIAVP